MYIKYTLSWTERFEWHKWFLKNGKVTGDDFRTSRPTIYKDDKIVKYPIKMTKSEFYNLRNVSPLKSFNCELRHVKDLCDNCFKITKNEIWPHKFVGFWLINEFR